MGLIIDCDPGRDDAVALALAVAARDELELRAVTTVSGNVRAELTAHNARRVLERCGATDVAVHPGCARPLLVDRVDARGVHGEDGLGGLQLPSPERMPAGEHAATRLARSDRDDGGAPRIAALGPLTNLAVALTMNPELAAAWPEVVVMGGAFDRGNVTEHAEFNLYADPHAAAAVLTSGARVTVVALDATREAIPDRAILERLAGASSGGARLFAELWRRRPIAVHDACVIAYLLRPELCRRRTARVRIVLDGDRRGETVADDAGAEIELITELDRDGVFALIEERLIE